MTVPDSDVILISHALNASLADPRIEAPEPGVYQSVPFDTYARWDAASNSVLSKLAPPSTPAHALSWMMTPPKKTEALILGGAIHCAVLEPEAFSTRYVREIEGDGRTKSIKDARERLRQDFPDAEIIGKMQDGQQMYDVAMRCADAILAHPAAGPLLERVADRELSITWVDEATGVTCKARLDAIAPSLRTIIDLKSTISAAPESFSRTIRYFGYHRQAAMYLDAVESTVDDYLGPVDAHQWRTVENYIFIAYEKRPPWAVAGYRLGLNSLLAGSAEVATLLLTYKGCTQTNHWPAYSNAIEDIECSMDDAGPQVPYIEGF